MKQTTEKWTVRIFTLLVIAMGIVTSVKLLGGKDLSMYSQAMVVIVLGLSIGIELGWKHVRALFDSKFQSSDILDAILVTSAVLCVASGVGMLLNIVIPVISSFTGIIVAVATILLIPQLFLAQNK